ncbi:hypothetical protein [Spartinivicinus ruber]|uniref:hypothetical protein n=1 Tax=Spartinivicinus ruber TaxID=2683272 RepID=UPI0013D18DCD|nr:hypothetical protein [Spartinivicinus ruber]
MGISISPDVVNPFNRFKPRKASKISTTISPVGFINGRQVSLLENQSSGATEQNSITSLRQKFTPNFLFSKPHNKPFISSTETQTCYENEKRSIKAELNDAIRQYLAVDNDFHESYMLGYAQDYRFKRYLAKDATKFNHLPETVKELRDLLNNLLSGHSKAGSLYKSINSKMTPNHALGRILIADGFLSPHLSVRKQPLADPAIIKQHTSKIVKEPTATQLPTNPEAIKRLLKEKKQRISQQLKERVALQTAARLSVAIISKRAQIATPELIVHKPELQPFNDLFSHSQDLAYLESAEQSLNVDIKNLIATINRNLEQLPTKKECSLMSLKKEANTTISEALNILHKNKKSLKERLFKLFFPKKYADQESIKNQLIADLNELQYLRRQIVRQPNWNNMDKAAWFQDTVYQLLQKATAAKLSFGPFEVIPSYCKEIDKQLSEQSPESQSTFYM